MVYVKVRRGRSRLLTVAASTAAVALGLVVCAINAIDAYRKIIAADEGGTVPALDGNYLGALAGVLIVQAGLAIGTATLAIMMRRDVDVGERDSAELAVAIQSNWILAGHVAGFFGVVPVGAIYLLCRRIDGEALIQVRESLNFQITLLLAAVISVTAISTAGLVVLWIVGSIFSTLATLNTSRAPRYRYPVSLRLVH